MMDAARLAYIGGFCQAMTKQAMGARKVLTTFRRALNSGQYSPERLLRFADRAGLWSGRKSTSVVAKAQELMQSDMAHMAPLMESQAVGGPRIADPMLQRMLIRKYLKAYNSLTGTVGKAPLISAGAGHTADIRIQMPSNGRRRPRINSSTAPAPLLHEIGHAADPKVRLGEVDRNSPAAALGFERRAWYNAKKLMDLMGIDGRARGSFALDKRLALESYRLASLPDALYRYYVRGTGAGGGAL